MRGPFPSYRPAFPPTFLEQAATLAGPRTGPYQVRQRAVLVMLLSQQPLVSNSEAAQRVRLHPRAVRRWRHRWATGTVPGRQARTGPQGGFFPSGPCAGPGGRLCTGRRNPATAEPPVPRRRHCPGPHRAGHAAQSPHGVAEARYGCHQSVAVEVLDVSV